MAPPQPHLPHRRYQRRFGVVILFALFQTETYLTSTILLAFLIVGGEIHSPGS